MGDPTAIRERISAEVRAHLARRRLHQSDLVAILGVNQGQISKRLRGHIPWTVDEVEALAEFFDVDVRDLVSPAGRIRSSGCTTGQLALPFGLSAEERQGMDVLPAAERTAARLRHPTGGQGHDARVSCRSAQGSIMTDDRERKWGPSELSNRLASNI